MSNRLTRILKKIAQEFANDHVVYWNHLSRVTGLLIVSNVSLFFLTELVIRQHYFYTFFSLLCYGVVEMGILLPLGLLRRLSYYLGLIVIELIGTYYLVVSVWYWVTTNRI